jgi:hypothetical protein
MNVTEIRQRVFDQMDYFPDLQQYRDSVVRRLNDRYQELCDSAHWLFLQKERTITLRQAITGDETTGVGITVSATNPRLVTVSGFTATLEMEGQTLTHTTDGGKFTIVRVLSSTTLYLSDAWIGTTGSIQYVFTITFQRFALPEDCIEVLGYMDRNDDRGKLNFIGRSREEYVYLDIDNSGEPSTVIEDEHIIDDPPVNKPLASILQPPSSINVTRLKNSTEYEYKYTVYREGRESPPSVAVSIEAPTTGNFNIQLDDLDDTGFYVTAAATSTSDSGMDKIIYRRDLTNNGKWQLVGTVSSTVTFFIDDELHPTTAFSYQNNTAFRFSSSTDILRWTDPGPRQYVRFWYTPSEDRNIHIRYHYRPKDLVADNDAPVLPRQYHMLLVYMVLQDMFLQMQDTVQSQLFERRAEQVKIQMRRRYLARDDERKKKGRWDKHRRFTNTYGTPTIS